MGALVLGRPSGLSLGGGTITLGKGGGVSIFDLRVNGQPLVVNSQQLKVTSNGN